MTSTEFIKSQYGNVRNAWTYNGHVAIYMRKSMRVLNGKIYDFIDIASVSVDEGHEGKGLTTGVIRELVDGFPGHNFYIESILNPAMGHIGSKLGFSPDDHDGIVEQKNMYLLRNQ